MTFFMQVSKTLERLAPKLDDLADGAVELVEADGQTGKVKVRLLGGRLH
jgi:hypothetical protein